jgi:pimeloyl-ACP methyl ester carboxylesterase
VQRREFLAVAVIGLCLPLLAGCAGIQRKYLFYPTHHDESNGLVGWFTQGKQIGYSRQVPAPENVWLMLHGNAGQAADRVYALPSFSLHDSVFILEYPGYGAREGKPSRAAFDAAAIEAYVLLRKTFPGTPICVIGESIGSGPACMLSGQLPPPDKIVLVVPFDRLTSVAAEHVRVLPVGWLLEAKWDNIRSLSNYDGPVEVFGAEADIVIPIEHARKLADSLASARFHSIPGGHNEWSREHRVEIRNP